MLNLIGADGKKSVHTAEMEQLEALKGDSIARETGSVPQTFNRIKSIKYHDGLFEFELKPDPMDLRDHMVMTYAEVFTKLNRMKESLKKPILADPVAAAEMLVELGRKLNEAIEKDDQALKEIQKAIFEGEQLKKARSIEDRVNGIIR
jgi:hypothetical protein